MLSRLLGPSLILIACALPSAPAAAGPELPSPASAAAAHDALVRLYVASDLCPGFTIDKYKLRALIVKAGVAAGWNYSQRPKEVERAIRDAQPDIKARFAAFCAAAKTEAARLGPEIM